MSVLFQKIARDYAHFTFEPGEVFVWWPEEETIQYDPIALETDTGIWSLLHELGHGELGHTDYSSDLQLMIMELQAWVKAKEIGSEYDVEISEDHINASVATYKNWLNERSRCIQCKTHAFQKDKTTYQCHNCQTKWQVPASVLCNVRKKRLK